MLALCVAPVFAADPLAAFYDSQLKGAEKDVTSLAAAMPANKYDFAPTAGAFTGVRTFGQQVKHLATVMYQVSAAALNQKPPVDTGAGDNGPDSVRTKEQVLAYLKGAFEYAHKSIATLTAQNQLENVKSPFGGTMPRSAYREYAYVTYLRSLRADGGLCAHERRSAPGQHARAAQEVAISKSPLARGARCADLKSDRRRPSPCFQR